MNPRCRAGRKRNTSSVPTGGGFGNATNNPPPPRVVARGSNFFPPNVNSTGKFALIRGNFRTALCSNYGFSFYSRSCRSDSSVERGNDLQRTFQGGIRKLGFHSLPHILLDRFQRFGRDIAERNRNACWQLLTNNSPLGFRQFSPLGKAKFQVKRRPDLDAESVP